MEEEQGERRRIVDDDIAVVFPKTWKLETRSGTMPKNGDVCCEKGEVLKWNKTTSMEKKTKKIQSN